MKAKSHFSNVILAIAVVIFSGTALNAQKLSDNTNNRVPAPLKLAIAEYSCFAGGSIATVYDEVQGFVFDSRRYQVTWVDQTGKLVSGQASMNECLCNVTLVVIVRDMHTDQVETLRHHFPRCINLPDEGPVKIGGGPALN
ncbi:MAG: hypothetical protein AAF502_19575 [Bacteroidota bacterium]